MFCVMGQIIEKICHVLDAINNDIAQSTTGIDGIATDRHTEAAGNTLEPSGAPLLEAGRVTLVLLQICLLFRHSSTKCIDDIPRASLRLISLF